MYKKSRLDNGLKIIAHSMPARQSLALGIWLKTGGRYESGKNKGISHFLEHLLFKGSHKYSCRSIKESIEGIGGSLNGFTSEELTCYLVKIPSRYLALAFDILADMVLNPALEQEEVEKERTVILEEIKMYRDLPQAYVYELLDELLWPGQALGSPVAGTLDSVSSITRNDIAAYQRQSYTPANTVLSIAGCFDYAKLRKMVLKIFSSCEKGVPNVYLPAQETQSNAQARILNKDTEQSHLALGFHSLAREHPLKHALGLLHVILGANMSSRLFNEVREKRGLAYEIGTQVKRFQDTGAFIVHAGIDNRKVTDALGVILKELETIKSDLVTPDEFKRAKEFYLGQLMLALEDTLDHMLWIGESTASVDKAYSLSDIIKEVGGVTREDILAIARQIFKSEKLNLSLIGPLEKSEKAIKETAGIS